MTQRILHIIPSLDRSGAEKQLTLLAAGLPRADYDVHVCALSRGGPLEAELAAANVPVHHVGKSRKVDPAAFWRLKKLIQALRPQLVQTWIFAANSYGRAAALAAGVPRIVASERCVDPWKVWHELAIDRWLAQRSARIIVNSSGVSDFYAAQGIDAGKFTLIPNGVELPKPSAISRAEMLDELGLPADARVIGAVNRLWPQKRVKDLIWAADLLKVVRPDVHLLIIGDGPQRDRLHRFRAQVCIEDKVHFLGHRNDVAQLMPHFDALWLASEYEGLPNAIMEAMSHAVPVVATNIPGNRDLVVDGETGYLVPVGDRAAIAKHTNRLLENEPLRKQLGTAGQQRVAQEFTVAKMVARHAALYAELLP